MFVDRPSRLIRPPCSELERRWESVVSQFRVLPRKVANVVRELRHTLQEARNPYRPELYYMRGPGPKWRQKHASVPVEAEIRLPAMVEVRG
jgi:hypothetical protein